MDRQEKARQARNLLDGDVMTEVWERAEAVFTREWKNGTTVAEREAAHAKTVGLAEVRRLLRTIITDGEYGQPG